MKKLLKILLFFSFLYTAVFIGSIKWLKVNHIDLEYDDIDEGLDGFKILHISDLHACNKYKMHINIWDAVQKEEFDIVCITGDLYNNSIDEFIWHLPYIEELAKEYPVYFVDGNHDCFDYNQICKILKNSGVTVLNNSYKVITHNDVKINVVGFRDYYYLLDTGFAGVDEAISKVKKRKNFTVCLEHQPQFYDDVCDDVDIMLSGHTHGGQIRLPFMPTLYAPYQGFFPKYGEGLYDFGNSKLYVSRGIGHNDLPIRFYNRPEIAVLNVKRIDSENN